MFAHVPTAQWGGADVAISVRVDSMVVWLWGDTISAVRSWQPYHGRYVHSTAITQQGGCLHVSHGGAQLLPDSPDGTWYWIASAAASGPHRMRITADRVRRSGAGYWGFKIVGRRTATAVVDGEGDVTFRSWTGKPVPVQHIVRKDGVYQPWSATVSEIASGRILVSDLPHAAHRFSYAPSVHPELRLTGGRTLLTVCRSATPLHAYADYRSLFFGVTLTASGS
jgi:hypothetical protein